MKLDHTISFLITCLLLVLKASATDLYVSGDPACQILGQGTIGSPYCTLTDALSHSVSDSIYNITVLRLDDGSPPLLKVSSLANITSNNASLFITYEQPFSESLNNATQCSQIPAILFDLDTLNSSYSFNGFAEISFHSVSLQVKSRKALSVNFSSSSVSLRSCCLSNLSASSQGGNPKARTFNVISTSAALDNIFINGNANWITLAIASPQVVSLSNIVFTFPMDYSLVFDSNPAISISGASKKNASLTAQNFTLLGSMDSSNMSKLYPVLGAKSFASVTVSNVSITGQFFLQDAKGIFSIKNSSSLNLSTWNFYQYGLQADRLIPGQVSVISIESVTNAALNDFTFSSVSLESYYSMGSVRIIHISASSISNSLTHLRITNFVFANVSAFAPYDTLKIFELSTPDNSTNNQFMNFRVRNITIRDQSKFENCEFFKYNPSYLFDMQTAIATTTLSMVPQRNHSFENIIIKDSQFINSGVITLTSLHTPMTTPIVEPEKIMIINASIVRSSFLSVQQNEDNSKSFISAFVANDAYALNVTSLSMTNSNLTFASVIFARNPRLSHSIRNSTFIGNSYFQSTILSEKMAELELYSMLPPPPMQPENAGDDDASDNRNSTAEDSPNTNTSNNTANGDSPQSAPPIPAGYSMILVSNAQIIANPYRLSRLTLLVNNQFANETLSSSTNYIISSNPLIFVFNNSFSYFSMDGDSTLLTMGRYENAYTESHPGGVNSDSYLYYNETGATRRALESLINDTSLSTGENFTTPIFLQFRVQNNTFNHFILSNITSIMKVTALSVPFSGTVISGNFFTGIQLRNSPGSSLMSFIQISHVEIRENNFSNIVFSGIALSFSQIQTEMKCTIIGNNVTNAHDMGFLQLESVKFSNLTIKANSFSNVNLTNSLIYINIFILAGPVTISKNWITDCRLFDNPFGNIAVHLIKLIIVTYEEGHSAAIKIKRNIIQSCYSSFTRNIIDDSSLILLSSGNILLEFSKNNLSDLAISEFESFFKVDSNFVLLRHNVFEELECSGLLGGMVFLGSSNVTLSNNTFKNMNLVNGSAGLIRFSPSVGDSAVFNLSDNVFTNCRAVSGSALIIQNTSANLYLYSNAFVDCAVTKLDGAVVELLGVCVQEKIEIVNTTIVFSNDSEAGWFANIFALHDLSIIALIQDEQPMLAISQINIMTEGLQTGNIIRTENIQFPVSILELSVTKLAEFNQTAPLSIGFVIIQARGSNHQNGLLILDSMMIKNAEISALALIKTENLTIRASNNTLKNLKLNQIDSSIFSIVQASTQAIMKSSILNSTFEEIQAVGGSSVVKVSSSGLIITKNLFYAVLSQNMRMLDTLTFVLNISNCHFKSLEGENGPAMFIGSGLYNSQVNIQNCIFENLTASDRGGAIWSASTPLVITNTSFSACSAVNAGDSIYVETDTDVILMNSLLAGQLAYGPNYLEISIMNQDSGLVLEKSGVDPLSASYVFSNATSHSFSEVELMITLSAWIDEGVYPVYDEKEAMIIIQFQLEPNQFPRSYSINNCTKGICYLHLPSIEIYGDKGEIKQGKIIYQSLRYSQQINFNVIFRACVPGELYNPRQKTCDYCGIGFMSPDPYGGGHCIPCPQGATCLNGLIAAVDEGYWRNSTTSFSVIPCNDTGARCLGDDQCAEGFTGILCMQCDSKNLFVQGDNYAYQCSKCSNSSMNDWFGAVILIATIIFQIFYFKVVSTENKSILSRISQQESDLDPTSAGPYIRMITTFGQLIAIISSLNLNLSQYFKAFDTINSSNFLIFFSLKCRLLDLGYSLEQILQFRILLFALSPFAKLLVIAFCIGVWSLLCCKRKQGKICQFTIYVPLGAITLVLLEQPAIISLLTKYLACESLYPGSDESYMKFNRNVKCYTDSYNSFRNYVVIPALIFWGLVVPGIIFLILVCKRAKLTISKTLILTMGSLYYGHTDKRYYWGLVIIIFKTIVCVVNPILAVDPKLKSVILVVLFYAYFKLIKTENPYKDSEFYQFEKKSIKIYFLTLFLIIIMIDSTAIMQLICLVFIGIANIYFFLNVGLRIIHVLRGKIVRNKLRRKSTIISQGKPETKPEELDTEGKAVVERVTGSSYEKQLSLELQGSFMERNFASPNNEAVSNNESASNNETIASSINNLNPVKDKVLTSPIDELNEVRMPRYIFKDRNYTSPTNCHVIIEHAVSEELGSAAKRKPAIFDFKVRAMSDLA